MPIVHSNIALRRARCIALAAFSVVSFPAANCVASTCVVNSSLDDPNDASAKVTSLSQAGWSGAQKTVITLRDCIVESNLMTGSEGIPTTAALTIELAKINGSVITLQDNLPLLFNNVTITTTSGNPVMIDGNFVHRIFFVSGLPPFKSSNVPDPDGSQSTAVALSNLVLEYGLAQGGDGSGGGLGAGGALFVNKAATVTLTNVSFKENMAAGGDALNLDQYINLSGGGMGSGMSVWKGGGGLGGPGLYLSGAGIGTPGTNQFAGGFGGTGIGQLSIKQNFSHADFDVDSGSGTLGGLIGGGGLAISGPSGNPGGFGGGGAFSIYNSAASVGGGNGGFAGGGAWAEDVGQVGGNGGFGGAGGAGMWFTTSGNGGFGAGAGGTGDFSIAGTSGVGGGVAAQIYGVGGGYFGGGGAGFGGAIFVRGGGRLQIESTSAQIGATGNMVLPGNTDIGPQFGSIEGAAAGNAIFAMTGAHTVFDIAKRYTIYDDIADDSLLSLPTGQTYVQGNGGGAVVTKTGVGTLVIDSIDSRAGLTDIQAGTLAGIGMLAGPVRLENGAQILPGDPLMNGGIGTLTTGSLLWYAGAAMAYQLGADDSSSDHLLIDGSLLKQGAGPFVFHFGTGANPPVAGQTYKLIAATNTSAFVAQDFSFDTDVSLQSLGGKFSVDANGVYFSVTAVQP